MKKILHVFGKMDLGGAETRTMDIYRAINKEYVKFDFLVMQQGKGYYDDEILKLGGKVITISNPHKVTIFNHIVEIINVLKVYGPYDVVHAHTSFHTGIISLVAFLAGVPIRVTHSRTASNSNNKGTIRKIYFSLMRFFINTFATNRIACGKDAAEFLYGKIGLNKVDIIYNSIDFHHYMNLSYRNLNLRESLGIKKNDIVIGHVGSFRYVKNHKFIIKILKELEKSEYKYEMIFVGDGKLRQEIEKCIIDSNLNINVRFLGIRSDVNQIMAMFDILLLPSLYEGLPGVVIEAQAAGTPCIVSDTITNEVDINLDLVKFLSISDARLWANEIFNINNKDEIDKNIIYNHLKMKGFLVENSIAKLYSIYKINE